MTGESLTVLHVAPHPDDELVGAPATLLLLRAAGHRVVNLACSLGRPPQHERRLGEVTEACRRAGFELIVHEPPLAISRGDDLPAARQALADTLRRLVAELGAALVVAPSPHDGHHGHETVARATLDALGGRAQARLWLWAIWGSLPLPTLYVRFGEETLAAALEALRAHAGELARNDYAALVRGRSLAAHALGSEQVFGLGAGDRGGRYAELLTEVAGGDGDWWAGAARELDASAPLAPVPRERRLGWWLRAPSFGELLAGEGRGLPAS